MNCHTCGGFGHVAAQCPTDFQGMCYTCGQWGHTSRFCTTHQAHVSTDEFERAQDGYPYNPNSDYYQAYNEAYAEENKQYDDTTAEEQSPGFFSVMMRVLDEPGESVLAARQHSVYDINLDSYCTRHMTPCFSLENAEAYEVNIMVGNKETLRSTHKGVMRLGNIAFQDVLFVPGLLQTLISEPQLEKRGCKIVSGIQLLHFSA